MLSDFICLIIIINGAQSKFQDIPPKEIKLFLQISSLYKMKKKISCKFIILTLTLWFLDYFLKTEPEKKYSMKDNHYFYHE